jgi:hypothetical protein
MVLIGACFEQGNAHSLVFYQNDIFGPIGPTNLFGQQFCSFLGPCFAAWLGLACLLCAGGMR